MINFNLQLIDQNEEVNKTLKRHTLVGGKGKNGCISEKIVTEGDI